MKQTELQLLQNQMDNFPRNHILFNSTKTNRKKVWLIPKSVNERKVFLRFLSVCFYVFFAFSLRFVCIIFVFSSRFLYVFFCVFFAFFLCFLHVFFAFFFPKLQIRQKLGKFRAGRSSVA